MELYKYHPTQQLRSTQKTAWGVVNAVTLYEDHLYNGSVVNIFYKIQRLNRWWYTMMVAQLVILLVSSIVSYCIIWTSFLPKNHFEKSIHQSIPSKAFCFEYSWYRTTWTILTLVQQWMFVAICNNVNTCNIPYQCRMFIFFMCSCDVYIFDVITCPNIHRIPSQFRI